MVPGQRGRRVAAVSAAALLLAAACTDADPSADETAPPTAGEDAVADLDCGDGEPIAQTLSSGATWSMCWQVDPKQGLVFTDVRFAPVGREPIGVLASLSLAQLEVPYDTGERLTSDITSAGFGGRRMHTLTETECVGDRIGIAVPDVGDGSFGESPVREVLCSEVTDGGLAYRSRDGGRLHVARRTDWQLSAISKVGWYEYISQYTFGADGTIRADLGATGDLSPVDYTDEDHGHAIGPGESDHAASHSHNAVWRVHWALGGSGGLAVEQYDAEPTGEQGPQAPVVAGRLTPLEFPATAQWVDRRWWRVVAPDVLNDDGHPISYQINVEATDSFTFVPDGHTHGEEAGYDVAFTNHDECEVFATGNRGGCGDGVLDYVADGAGEPLDDVVSWVAVGFHHVVRDEDQSPMDVHWQGFSLTPRDLTAQRPDPPEDREDLNGRPPDPEAWPGPED